MLKDGKSPGNDNIPSELINYGGKHIAKIYTTICHNIWKTKMVRLMDKVFNILMKCDYKTFSNYRTLNLIPHPNKILLRIIVNRLTHQAEQILAEKQAGFRK